MHRQLERCGQLCCERRFAGTRRADHQDPPHGRVTLRGARGLAAGRSPRRRGATSASAGWPRPSGSPWRGRSSRSALNSSGGTKRSTAACLRVGCRYWPMVRKSTSAARRSSITCITSSALAQADHDAGLGELCGIELLHPLQQAQRGEVARAGPDREIERRHGLEIVVEHVGPRRHHGLGGAVLAQEVRRQHLDGGRRRRARGSRGSRLREMLARRRRRDRRGRPR